MDSWRGAGRLRRRKCDKIGRRDPKVIGVTPGNQARSPDHFLRTAWFRCKAQANQRLAAALRQSIQQRCNLPFRRRQSGVFILEQLDQSKSKRVGFPPKRVLLVFAVVFTPVGLGLSTRLGYDVCVDLKKIQVQGVVRDVRVFVDDHRPLKSGGRWLNEWLVEYATVGGPSRRWFSVCWYRTDREAESDRDIGKTVPVWYSPGVAEDATIVPPQLLRNCLWAGWSAIIGAAGIISI